jgi:hypothetical protein
MNSGHFFIPCRFVHTGFYSPDLRHQDGVKIATLPLVTKCSLVPLLGHGLVPLLFMGLIEPDWGVVGESTRATSH